MTGKREKNGGNELRLRTYSDADLARTVLYGRGLRKQLRERKKRAAAGIRRRVAQPASQPSPSASQSDGEEEDPARAAEPWTRHPLALLGFYKQYIPAQADAQDMLASAQHGAKPPASKPPVAFSAHSAMRFRDTALDSLNPGWEPTVHVFEVPPPIAKKLNIALTPEMTALARTTRGLRVSNRGGGFHSTQHLFSKSPSPALSKLESFVSAAAAAASRAERLLAAGSDSEGDASSLQPSSDGGADGAGDGARDRPVNSWVNVGTAGAYHGLHDHVRSVWSGVYYVSVPPDPPGSTSGGRIVFRTAVGGAVGREAETIGKNEEKPVGWCRFAVVDPKPGRLVLFPGWLPHAVTPLPLEGDGGGVRISISFNIGVEADGDDDDEPAL